MKKSLLTLVVGLLMGFSGYGQGLSLSWEGATLDSAVTVWGEPSNQPLVFRAMIHNNTDKAMFLYMRREVDTLLQGSVNYLHWGVNLPPDADTPPDTVFLPAGGQTDTTWFEAYYIPNGAYGSSYINYVFFDSENQETQVSIRVRFWTSPQSVEENETLAGNFSEVYPNPAASRVKLDYSLSPAVQQARIRIFNLQGVVLKEKDLSRGATSLTLDVSDLNNGIYFYSIFADGKLLKTKKLIIRN